MESKIVTKGRRGVLSHFTRQTIKELSYIWTCSASLEDAFFRYANAVGDIVTEDDELIFVKYSLKAIEEFNHHDAGIRESGKLYLSKLVDGMEAMTRHNVISGTAPFESVFDIYSESFVHWHRRINAANEPYRITRTKAVSDHIRLRESARIVLLSKIANSNTLMMMGIIPMRTMEVS